MRSRTNPSVFILIVIFLLAALIFVACSSSPQATSVLTPVSSAPVLATEPAIQIPTATLPLTSTQTQSPQATSALIIVEFGPNDRVVRQISVTDPISGIEALQATGLEIVTADFGDSGVAVCSIAGVGCPAEDCFCSSQFWSSASWSADAWQLYQSGPSSVSIAPGAIEGWQWTEVGSAGLPPAPALVSIAAAYNWMQNQQDPATGGYDSPSTSLEVLLAIGANRLRAEDWSLSAGSPSLMDYWQANAQAYSADGPASSGKLAVGLAAAGGCWPAGAAEPSSYYSGTNGQYSPHAGFQAWGILGSLALSQTVPMEAVDYLITLAQPDGGWEWNQGFGSDTNTTALVIQTLVAVGEPPDSEIIAKALQYLKSAQNSDGGFTYSPTSQFGTDSDVNSTAYVLQSLLAAGQSPISDVWSINGVTSMDYLPGMQLDNGSYEWQPGSGENLVATAHAAAALLGRTYPLHRASLSACP